MEDVNLPLISVIVPVYNVGEYLEQCINSIIKQTYHNQVNLLFILLSLQIKPLETPI